MTWTAIATIGQQGHRIGPWLEWARAKRGDPETLYLLRAKRMGAEGRSGLQAALDSLPADMAHAEVALDTVQNMEAIEYRLQALLTTAKDPHLFIGAGGTPQLVASAALLANKLGIGLEYWDDNKDAKSHRQGLPTTYLQEKRLEQLGPAKQTIMKRIFTDSSVTRAQLSQELAISRPSVTQHVAELQKAGWLVATGSGGALRPILRS